MKATLFPILAEVLLKNQPEGVQLCIKQVRKLHFIIINTALLFIYFYLSCCIYDTSINCYGLHLFCFLFLFFSTRKQIFKPDSKQGLSLRGLLQKLIINTLFKNVFHVKWHVFFHDRQFSTWCVL